MDYKCQAKVTTWITEKGYGFVTIPGEGRAFVHVSDISPWQERGANFFGQMLVVYATENDQKGTRVTSAATLEEHERRLREEAEKAAREELTRLEEARKKQEAEELLESRSEELRQKLALLFSEGKVEADSMRNCQFENLGDNIIAKIPQAEARIISEEPVLFQADVFAELSVSESPATWWRPIATATIGPIGSVTLGWEALKVGSWENNILWLKEDSTVKAVFFPTDKQIGFVYVRGEFPASAGTPYREHEEVFQKLSAVTPCDELSKTLCLSKDDAVWGDFETASLLSEASIRASHNEIWHCLRRKFAVENVPAVWEESGSNWTSHEDSGAGMHGGDYVSETYINKCFADEVDRLYAMDLRKELLVEIEKLPVAAIALGWSFTVPHQYGIREWPSVFVPVVVRQTNNDLKGVNRPRFIDPVQQLGYAQALEAVLVGMSAEEAVQKFLGECPKPEALSRQMAAGWARSCRKDGPRGSYGGWRNPPSGPKTSEKVARIFAKLKEKQLRKEGIAAEEAREAAENAAKEQCIVDLANVRKNWRELLTWRLRSLRSLHTEAQALLEKIRVAQSRAEEIKRDRNAGFEAGRRRVQYEADQLAREKAEETKREQDGRFLTGNAWGALDKLKFD